MRTSTRRLIITLLLLPLALAWRPAAAQAQAGREAFNGNWVVNGELSSDTDRQVEIAIISAGGRPPNTGKKGPGRYRGGPEEHALYDHVSYDKNLFFHYAGPEFRLYYDDGYTRVFHDDNRKRVVSASGTSAGDGSDFSFASWDGDRLIVESTVRDGGWIFEQYRLTEGGTRLKVDLELKPASFANPVRITRIYDRRADQAAGD